LPFRAEKRLSIVFGVVFPKKNKSTTKNKNNSNLKVLFLLTG